MNPIFLDAEFTGLDQRHPRLISIALAPYQGDDSLYLELRQEDSIDQASYSTLENVVPHLLGGASIVPVATLCKRIAVLPNQKGTVRVVTDYPEYDFTHLKGRHTTHTNGCLFVAGYLGFSDRTAAPRLQIPCDGGK